MAKITSKIATAARLEEFFDRVGTHLKDRRKRESFAMYAYGILGDGERKSAEPIAGRAGGDPRVTNNLHSKLLYFLGRSEWDDRAVRLEAARYAVEELERREPVTTWIVDDTGFLKQGSHSVGVQRQYTGSAGKTTNCQIGVSLAIATSTNHLPLDFELYLPEEWATNPALRKEARIPADVTFQTKIELAIDMIERASLANDSRRHRPRGRGVRQQLGLPEHVRLLGFDFGVGIQSNARVVRLDRLDRVRGEVRTAAELAAALGRKAFRRVTWRQGSKAGLSSHFCFVRVKTMHDDGIQLADREPLWLIIEWLEGEEKPTKFALTTLPRRMSRKAIVRLFKERWRTERMYEDLKGELGLDHFEGRSYPAWHHHISVVLCCYAFVVADLVRAFPPSARRARKDGPVGVAA